MARVHAWLERRALSELLTRSYSRHCRALVLLPLLWAGRAIAQEDAGPTDAPIVAAPPAAPSRSVLYDLLTFYKDNYFLTGFTKATEVKFQFSAKFDLWPNDGPHAVYFAYSQKSLWDLYLTSAPFVENNYNPEVFYTFFHSPGRYTPPPGCGFFYDRLGAEHESNGLSGADSREWNRVYLETRVACSRASGVFASATLKVWAPPFDDGDNQNIVDYLGYGELTLAIGSERGAGWLDQWNLTVVGRKGTSAALGVGSLEVDGRWRPPFGPLWRFTPFLYGQLFTGYGETLLTYDHPVTAFRLGIGLSDTSTRSR